RTQSPAPSVPASGKSLTSSEKERRASGAFAGGAAITSPTSRPDDDPALHQRAATAESGLSDEAVAKINKAELKDAKRLSKVIKGEGAAQKKHLDAQLKELANLQKLQKKASAEESKTHAAQGKASKNVHKLRTKYLQAKADYERSDAELRAKDEQYAASCEYAQQMTEKLGEKTHELEELRRQKGVDDREREAKLVELAEARKKN
ncbi:hypothetical protein DFH11DRAFT_1503376, partial [Phellopilus nigrolimitatus]